MASDFGDESGGQLCDWLLRIGQDAGHEAMVASADKLAEAFKKACEGLGSNESGEVNEWAKLDMKDFSQLPEYESLKEVIGSALKDNGVVHEFANEAGKDYLVFKVKDVHEVSAAFKSLEKKTQAAKVQAIKRADPAVGRDEEPLEQRAQAAREASKALEAMKGTDRTIHLSQNISK